MMVRVVNRSTRLVTLPLKGGGSVHLAPGETSGEIDEREVAGNAWVLDAARRDLVAVEPVARRLGAASPKGPPGSGKKPPKRTRRKE